MLNTSALRNRERLVALPASKSYERGVRASTKGPLAAIL
jgi:hypothetical protein